MYYRRNGELLKESTTPAAGALRTAVGLRFGNHYFERIDMRGKAPEPSEEVLMSALAYNSLGQLVNKKLHSRDEGETFLQDTDYRYHIRGWLERVNDPEAATEDPAKALSMSFSFNHGFTNPQYNGSISGMRWKILGQKEQAYGYRYDGLNRLTRADYIAKAEDDTWTAHTDEYSTEVTYDLYGNITRLKRKGLTETEANGLQPGLIDDLEYTYDGTRLKNIRDWSEAREGYKDDGVFKETGIEEYHYDEEGRMTDSFDKDITKIAYNQLNMPERITYRDGREVVHHYTGDGAKQRTEYYLNGQLQNTTTFVGSVMLDNGEISHLVYDDGFLQADPDQPTGWLYTYDLKDHLGNTWVTIAENDPVDYLATFEADKQTEEEYEFGESRKQGNLISAPVHNHTEGGSVSQRLLGYEYDEAVGISKSLEVYPGDKIDMEVYASYGGYAASNPDREGLTFGAMFLQAMGIPYGPETGLDATAFDGLAAGASGGATADPAYVPAYLNYVLFDENMEQEDLGFIQLSASGGSTPTRLNLSIDIEVRGYIFIYVSNESPEGLEVYFDDFKVTHTPNIIIQSEAYYPFGLTFDGFKRGDDRYTGTVSGTGSGFRDLGFRDYEPATGRFYMTDPLAELQLDHSPYHYALNNPIRNIDALGLQGMQGVNRTQQSVPKGVEGMFVPFDQRFGSKKSGSSGKAGSTNGGSDDGKNGSNTKAEIIKVVTPDTAKEPGKVKFLVGGSAYYRGSSNTPPTTENTTNNKNTSDGDSSGEVIPLARAFAHDRQAKKLLSGGLFTNNSPSPVPGNNTFQPNSRAQINNGVAGGGGKPTTAYSKGWNRKPRNMFPWGDKLSENKNFSEATNSASLQQRVAISAMSYDQDNSLNNKYSRANERGSRESEADEQVEDKNKINAEDKFDGGNGIRVDTDGDEIYASLETISFTPEYADEEKTLLKNAIMSIQERKKTQIAGEEYLIDLAQTKLQDFIDETFSNGPIAKDQFLFAVNEKANQIQAELDQISTAIDTESTILDFTGITPEERAGLETAVAKYEQRGVSSRITIVKKEHFETLKEYYLSDDYVPDKDVEILLSEDENGNQIQHMAFREGFYTIPAQAYNTQTGEAFVPTGTEQEVQGLIRKYGDHALAYDKILSTNLEVPEKLPIKDSQGNLIEIPETQKNLSAFEKLMMVAETGKVILDNRSVVRMLWDENSEDYDPRYFGVPDPLAGGANASLDKLNSITEMMDMAMSAFDKEMYTQVWDALSEVTMSNVVDMIQTQATDVAENPMYHGMYFITDYSIEGLIGLATGGIAAIGVVQKLIKWINKFKKLSKIAWGNIKQRIKAATYDRLKKRFNGSGGSNNNAHKFLQNQLKDNPELAEAFEVLAEGGLEETFDKNPKLLKRLGEDMQDAEFADWIKKNPDKAGAWKKALDEGIDDIIRNNPDYLEMLDRFPFGTGKKSILDNATDAEWNQILSGKLIELPDPDPKLSSRLKEKFGSNTHTSKKFDTDPTGKEFDAITDQFYVEHKALTSTNPMSQAKRTQMKYHMKACKISGKDNYLILEGVQNDDWINKAIQYANEYGVNTKIEINGVLVHDLTF
ncbi:RHS repeat domain-containing protein [Roseivirga sp. BDSF3-8]|uniref:RHS repeat domain-containing protein n=1 Tax=Roseivirga sp. BDSF3-8 TaxID=3241598 RepID=UPI0035327B4D